MATSGSVAAAVSRQLASSTSAACAGPLAGPITASVARSTTGIHTVPPSRRRSSASSSGAGYQCSVTTAAAGPVLTVPA